MSSVQLISTEDGSHSLMNTVLQETYHSVHGAIQESNHVFIKHGLEDYATTNPRKPIRILEVGFGTGLNTFLTLLYSVQREVQIHYESWEKYPLPDAIVAQLNYASMLGDPIAFSAIHQAPWNMEVQIKSGFSLLKRHSDILNEAIVSSFDIIYYDAFAPSKQPEMWTRDLFKKITDTLVLGGIFVTYCAKGQVKRDLASLGLVVETLPGPPGKKEMTRARSIFQNTTVPSGVTH